LKQHKIGAKTCFADQLIGSKPTCQAVFQVGFNVQYKDLEAIEIRDYLVKIKASNNVEILPIKMKYITFT